jgi:SAM-dependent methyltransferase
MSRTITSLDPLPFPSNHFDLVRNARLTFHYPEDEVSDLYAHKQPLDVTFFQAADIAKVGFLCTDTYTPD